MNNANISTTEQRMQEYAARQAERALAAIQLRSKHPHLVAANIDKGGSLTAAAKNVRIELKAAFPGAKFAVRSSRYSGGDSIDVRWTDGPTTKAVDTIICKYSGGSFDGMTDCYNYEASAWTDAFGDAKYVHSQRVYSDAAIEWAIDIVFAEYAGNLRDVARSSVTAEEYKQGRLYRVQMPHMGDGLDRFINVALSQRDFGAQGA